MNTIAGEETNSDGREVIMIAPEKERIDAEMTGTTGMTVMKNNIVLNSVLTPLLLQKQL